MNKFFKYAELSEKSYKNNIDFPGYYVKFISSGSTQCYVLISDSEQIVVFRGTERNIEDISTDLKVRQKGGIHRGFQESYQSIIGDIYKVIDSRKKVVFTGHSLGGALAILACCFHGHSESEAITFGSPRVFGRKMAKVFKYKKITRFENSGDPIPYIPFYHWGYRHVGECNLLTQYIKSVRNPAPFTPFMDMFFSSFSQKSNSHSIVTYKEKLQRIQNV